VGAVRASVEALKAKSLSNCIADLRTVCADLPYVVYEMAFKDESEDPATKRTSTMVGEQLFEYRVDYFYLHDIGPQEWELVREHLYAYAAIGLELKEMMDGGRIPEIRQVVIMERGEKTRMVTPVTSCVVYFSIFLNSLLLGFLRGDPRMGLRETAPMQSFINSMEGSRWGDGYVLRSVDMTRATDLMPFGVVSPIVEGILEKVGWTPFLKNALRFCTGPMQMYVDFPPYAPGHSVTTTCGILMGLGTSWPILSLFNLGLMENAWTKTGERRFVSKRERGRVGTVGDDLEGYLPKTVSNQYTANLEMTGGAPSAGKDMESFSCGVLVEELVVITKSPTGRVAARLLRTGSVRPLLEGVTPEKGSPPLPIWAMGPTMCRAIKEYRDPAAVIDWLLDYYYETYRMLAQRGVSPFLPREVGGANMPCHPKDVTHGIRTLRPKWVRAIRCAMSQDKTTTLLHHLSSAWSTGAVNCLSQGERQFWITAAAEAVQALGPMYVKDGELGSTPDQCAERALAMVANAKRLATSVDVVEPSVSVSRVGQRLNRGIEFLNTLVPWPRLKGKAGDLGAGVRSFIERASRRVHPRSLLSVTHVTTTQLGGVVEGDDPFGLLLA